MRCTCLADYWLWCFRDTVASFGFLNAGSLPFVGTNDIIRVFRQALSLDEVCGVRRIRVRNFGHPTNHLYPTVYELYC